MECARVPYLAPWPHYDCGDGRRGDDTLATRSTIPVGKLSIGIAVPNDDYAYVANMVHFGDPVSAPEESAASLLLWVYTPRRTGRLRAPWPS